MKYSVTITGKDFKGQNHNTLTFLWEENIAAWWQETGFEWEHF